MTVISMKKWSTLRDRMLNLGIHESDIKEQFVLGGGPGGQKVNATHNVVQICWRGIQIKSAKYRDRDANRYDARQRLCDAQSKIMGIKTVAQKKSEKAAKQKKRRRRKSMIKYAD